MAGDFDPLGFVGGLVNDAGNAVQGAVGAVASGAGEVAQGAVSAVGQGIGAVGDAVGGVIEDVFGPDQEDHKRGQLSTPRLEPRYAPRVRGDVRFLLPKDVEVRRVTRGIDGKPFEGRPQNLRMDLDGVTLMASTKPLAHKAERIPVSNVALFQQGEKPESNPLLAALMVGVLGSPVLGLVVLLGSMAPQDRGVWYLYVLRYDGGEDLFKLGSREDGDRVVEFLDGYMLPETP